MGINHPPRVALGPSLPQLWCSQDTALVQELTSCGLWMSSNLIKPGLWARSFQIPRDGLLPLGSPLQTSPSCVPRASNAASLLA